MQSIRIIVTVGLPGCGKSTYLRSIGANPISSDDIRLLLSDDATNQQIHRRVFSAVRYLVRQRLEMHRPETYVDATNLTRWERRTYIKMGDLYGAEVDALFFDVPLAVCKERNQGRGRIVPDEAMEMMARKLVAPTVEEGFRRVLRVGASTDAILSTTTEPPGAE